MYLLHFIVPEDAQSMRKAERWSCGKCAQPAQVRGKTNGKYIVLHSTGEAAEVFKYITIKITQP